MRVSNKLFQIAQKNHKYALSFLYQNVYNPLKEINIVRAVKKLKRAKNDILFEKDK